MKKLFVILFLYLVTPKVGALELGRLAYGVSLHAVNVQTVDGRHSEKTDVGLFSLFYLDDISRDYRYYAELSQFGLKTPADISHIGYKTTSTGMRVVVQKKLRLWRSVKPWLGVGVAFSNEEQVGRHTVDGDGFLTAVLPNKTETIMSVSLDVMNEWAVTTNLDVGVRLLTVIPDDSALIKSSLTFIVAY